MRYKTCQAGAIAPAPLLATFWNVLARDHQVFAKISNRRAAILSHDDRILDTHPVFDSTGSPYKLLFRLAGEFQTFQKTVFILPINDR